ncbi:hypothetical protein MNBD_NITROSPIRAE02-926, partial [hydrothermal vent metagenome]
MILFNLTEASKKQTVKEEYRLHLILAISYNSGCGTTTAVRHYFNNSIYTGGEEMAGLKGTKT